MKRTLLLFLLLVCRPALADTILLKDGRVIEGKITQVRSSYIRIQSDYHQPFREFLVENVANVIPSSPDEASQAAVQNIHQRSVNEAAHVRLQEAAQKRADVLIEEAIQNSELLSLGGTSEEVRAVVREKVSALIGEAVKDNDILSLADAPEDVKVVAQEKANVLIGEAVKSAEPPHLDQAPNHVRLIAQQKAGGLIEQAVKTVEISPFDKAPEGAQLAAKKAASILIKEAFLDEEVKKSRFWSSPDAPVIQLRKTASPENKSLFSLMAFIMKDPLSGGLLAFLFVLILILMVRGRKMALAVRKEEEFEPVLEQAVVQQSPQAVNSDAAAGQSPTVVAAAQEATTPTDAQAEAGLAEKRSHPRVQWDIPVHLYLDNIKPVTAVIKNLSLGGAYAVCNDFALFKRGDRCRFNLNLSDKDARLAINSDVEVVRLKPNRGLGLKFIDLKGNSLNYLRQVLM